MATAQEITDEIGALEAVFPFRVARTGEQYAQWLMAYIEELRDCDIAAIKAACREWRKTGEKFPLISQLLPFVRKAAEPKSGPVCNQAWAEASPAEYHAMSIEAKIRESMLRGHAASDRAVQAAMKAGWNRDLGAAPDIYHQLMKVADAHYADAKRLRERLKDYRDAA